MLTGAATCKCPEFVLVSFLPSYIENLEEMITMKQQLPSIISQLFNY